MKRYKKQDPISYALGITLCFELLENRLEHCTKVYVHSSFVNNDTYQKINKLCNENNIPIETNDKAFNILSNKENCFAIGEFTKFQTDIKTNNSHIVLVNPSNIGNLGTIIRTATGFGINDIVIIKPAVDIFDPKTIRASMGSVFNIRFKYFESFEEYKNSFVDRKYYIFMLSENSNPLHKFEIKKPYSLVFGNEATGLPEEFNSFGEVTEIKHLNTIDSLNLSIAVGIALYEFTKERF